jgi:hypothetical protein
VVRRREKRLVSGLSAREIETAFALIRRMSSNMMS